jgi:hypothetical protein
MSRCLLSGCRLVIADEGKSLWGDLHSVAGHVYVFAGVRDGETLQPAWSYDKALFDLEKGERQVRLHGDYFERRAIVTFSAGACTFNEASRRHIGDM